MSEHRNRPVSCYYTQALPNRFNLYCACCQSSPTIHLKCSSCSSSMPGASNFPMFCSASNLATSSLCQAVVSRGQTPINPCKPGWVDWGGRCFYMSTGTKNWWKPNFTDSQTNIIDFPKHRKNCECCHHLCIQRSQCNCSYCCSQLSEM